MMVKILQGAVVLFSTESRMPQYKEFVGIIFPIFLSMVVPALIGSPLTDYVRARAAKISDPKAVAEESPSPAVGFGVQQPPAADGSGQGLVG